MAKRAANGLGKKSGKGSRRSKAESSTGAKENAVEVRTLELPEPIVLSDDDFDLHYKAAKNAKERMKTAKSLWNSCMKGAKKVSVEMHEAVKRAVEFDGKDPEDIRKDLEIRGYVLKRRAHPIQMTLHNTLLGDVNEQAYARGFDDGKNGRTSKCPYPEGSEPEQHYSKGWRNGTAANLGLNEDQAEAAVASSDDEDHPDPDAQNLEEERELEDA